MSTYDEIADAVEAAIRGGVNDNEQLEAHFGPENFPYIASQVLPELRDSGRIVGDGRLPSGASKWATPA